MKHDTRLIAETALPDAPLAMPKQELERPMRLFERLRQALLSFSLL